MGVEPALNNAALRVRDSLVKFATSKGWAREDYRIFMSINEVWGPITVELVSRAFDGPQFDEKAQYDEVLDFLEQDLEDDPELYEAIGLILRPFAKYPFHAFRMMGENNVEIDDAILNPDVKGLRPPEGPGFI